MEEVHLLNTVLENPANDDSLLVYADWLEEQDDEISLAKSEFLRLTVSSSQESTTKRQRKTQHARLQELASDLDTRWLAVVSRMPIDLCGSKRAHAQDEARGSINPLQFDLVCRQRWEDMQPTQSPNVRFCEGCEQAVYYCDTIGQARRHAQQHHCVAIDVGIQRRPGDLAELRLRGRILPSQVRRQFSDPVSEKREQAQQAMKKK